MADQDCSAFRTIEIPKEMKLFWVATQALREDTLNWWFYWKKNNYATWLTFEKAVLKRFQPELWVRLPHFDLRSKYRSEDEVLKIKNHHAEKKPVVGR